MDMLQVPMLQVHLLVGKCLVHAMNIYLQIKLQILLFNRSFEFSFLLFIQRISISQALHTLKLGFLPISMRWFFKFTTMHKYVLCIQHKDNSIFSMHTTQLSILLKPKAYHPYVLIFLGDKVADFLGPQCCCNS